MSSQKELLEKFQYVETLNWAASQKSAALLGTIEGEHAILLLEKTPFEEKQLAQSIGVEEINQLDSNDIYSWGLATLIQDTKSNPAAKISLIYPATQTHINKHRKQKTRLIRETPEMYKNYVVPYIETMKGDRLKWVDNILFHGAEADRVLVRDDDPDSGFVLLPNMKWDRKTVEALYLMAVVLRSDLASIRDLNSSHLPLLKKLRTKVLKAIKSTYAVHADQLKLYFHYQPSYYHLHIHVAHVSLDQSDFGRSVLLDNVIDQLESLGSKGFTESTLTYIIAEGHDLWKDAFSKIPSSADDDETE